MNTFKTTIFSALLSVTLTSSAWAGIAGQAWGTAAPPAALDTYSMTSFAPDLSLLGGLVAAVNVPPGATPTGSVAFSAPLEHWNVNAANPPWLTWSNGYTGDVYWFDTFFGAGPADSLVLTLPTGTKAFYLYVEPNFIGLPGTPPTAFDFDVSAATDASETFSFLVQPILGNAGAAGFGFYATGGASLTTITVTGYDTWPDGFAIGEFGINGTGTSPKVPDHGAPLNLLLAVMIALAGLRQAKSR